MAKGNKEYKSDVFSMLMQDRRRALEVYNAINGTAYDDPAQVELTTLEDRSFSLTVRNDASFILDANLVCVLDGAQAMGDSHGGTCLHQLFEGVLY